MTTYNDLPRIFAFLSVLGTEGESKGKAAWDAMDGWKAGPAPAPKPGVIGGGTGDADAEDRKDQAAQQRLAAKRFQLYRVNLAALEKYARGVMADIDTACPPNPEDVKNRRTGELDPITPSEAAISGWCSSCWRNDQQMVPIDVDRKGFRRFRDVCRFCGEFKRAHGVDIPLALLKLRHEGRSLTVAVVDEAVKKAKQAAAPKTKKGKRKKGKVAA